ncbi:alpha/beta hydrolase [Streptomyces sp. UNOC14_S4]|uniref:alpha/beta hydrolase n=1 Tax=Streptomyces sp. UNOC14_S4 TaxID=2872340 RepID=UPI001E575DD8|nr:alpha/beta fold hydrolase [Streptomyces sp. UNOC14_S4]MCC3766715.1 alpha/beta hydrolase [Streptomyces sp. UNOC14_S4]
MRCKRYRSTRTVPLLVAGVAAAVSLSAPTPATAAAAEGPLRPYAQQKLTWQRCGADVPEALQCATLKVPLDYGDPGGRTIDLAISRLKASSAKERRGVLLLNPGGPGEPGLTLPADPILRIPDAVKRQYDLIGFDLRGAGQSSPVSCGLTPDEQSNTPYKDETFAKDVEQARTVAEKCRAKAGDKLPHLTTRNAARDMDVIRTALGEKKISYLGVSYGTYLGAVYTQLFPQRADRFVLDSSTDPTRVYRGMFQDMAKAAEQAFTRWTEWAAARHATYGLGGTPAEVRKTYWDLIARANREPVHIEGQALTGDGIRADNSTFFHVRKATEWIAGLKKAAENGNAEGKSPAPSNTPGQAEESKEAKEADDNYVSVAWSFMCADTRTWSHDPEQYRREAIRDRARYPLYGDFAANITPCAFWKQGSEPQTEIDNTASALMVQNEWDSQTPLFAARAMHRALRGSRMLTVSGGEGHGVLYAPGGNSCADKAATAYLTTGRLPAEDLTCRASAG